VILVLNFFLVILNLVFFPPFCDSEFKQGNSVVVLHDVWESFC
jgi:hypothetical protein